MRQGNNIGNIHIDLDFGLLMSSPTLKGAADIVAAIHVGEGTERSCFNRQVSIIGKIYIDLDVGLLMSSLMLKGAAVVVAAIPV